MLQETQILTLISTDEVITPTQLRSLLDRFANRFTRKYRLYRFTDEVAIKIRYYIFTDTHVTILLLSILFTPLQKKESLRGLPQDKTLKCQTLTSKLRLWDATGLRLQQTLTLQPQTAVFFLLRLRRITNFFVWTGLIMLGEALPAFLLTQRWFANAGKGNGGKLPYLTENDNAFL